MYQRHPQMSIDGPPSDKAEIARAGVVIDQAGQQREQVGVRHAHPFSQRGRQLVDRGGRQQPALADIVRTVVGHHRRGAVASAPVNIASASIARFVTRLYSFCAAVGVSGAGGGTGETGAGVGEGAEPPPQALSSAPADRAVSALPVALDAHSNSGSVADSISAIGSPEVVEKLGHG